MAKYNLNNVSDADINNLHKNLTESLTILSKQYQESVLDTTVDIKALHEIIENIRGLHADVFDEFDRRAGYPYRHAQEIKNYEGSF